MKVPVTLTETLIVMKTTKQSLPTRQAYKLAEAAEILGISVVTLRRAIKRGLIVPIRAFRHVLLSSAELDRFIGETPTRGRSREHGSIRSDK